MERRRKVLKKLRGKKMSRRGGTQWIDTASTTTANSSSPESSKRSSVRSEAAGSLCSWDPSTEQAINVGLMGYETAIIEEAEEEEEQTEGAHAEIKPEQEPRPVEPVQEPRPVHDLSSKAPSENDTKSEFGYDSESFISRDESVLGTSSATDIESTFDGQSMVEVSVNFDQVDVRLDSKVGGGDDRTVSDRSSYSSIGSGYDAVVEYHEVFFASLPEKTNRASMSESSLGSF